MSKNFEAQIRKNMAAKAQKNNKKRMLNIILVMAAVVIIGVAIWVIKASLYTPSLDVDWEGYGKALAEITEKYDDCDRVIVRINDNIEINKYEYYKLKVLNDYTFNAIIKEYEEYITTGAGASLSDEAKEALRPSLATDDTIISSLVDVEIEYDIAVKAGVEMDYDKALKQVTELYETYNNILLVTAQGSDLYNSTRESLEQMKLVSKGMGKSMDDYLKYLAEDSMKSLAIGELEEIWQDEFKESDYEGTVDEYIEEKYKGIKETYTVALYDLEK